MTEKNRHASRFAIGLLAECCYLLIMIGSAMCAASPTERDMCPTMAYLVCLLLAQVLLYVSVRLGVSIFKWSPATGVSYFLVLAIVALVVGIVAGLFFFDLTQWWARAVAPWNLFRRQCF
ncbi:hypothetical protein QZM82_31900 [Burkholderia cepacia]|uniref:hypothetical protein n=1 Tax=Burkholderia cepacia TaxID=292 RepID=UPI0026549DE9|nr:hypothetical protein [Burkholderia cepacia]MDN7900804.1 hypothetical protein [Burkholderia cepacia]